MESCFSEVTVTLTSILLPLNTAEFWGLTCLRQALWVAKIVIFLPLNLMGGFSILWQLAFQKAKKEWKYLLGYLTSSCTCQIWEIVSFFSFCILQCYAGSQYGGSEFQRVVSTHCEVENAESLVPMAAVMCEWKEMLYVFPGGAHPILLWWTFLRGNQLLWATLQT